MCLCTWTESEKRGKEQRGREGRTNERGEGDRAEQGMGIIAAQMAGGGGDGHRTKAVRWYSLMMMDGIGPISFMFLALLKACSFREDVGFTMRIHGQIVSVGGFGCELFVGNTMIDMYVKCGF